MGFRTASKSLFWAPELNPITKKARSIPMLNPINMYGRIFFFSWFGFMIAFWAWYAFPPLLTETIKHDLKLTPAQVANSNIVSLSATLFIRLISGPLCDQFGPRKVFGGLLLLGAIPVGLAPLIHTASGLYTVRFFIGILGGTFVPCQVWSTGFFDKNVVGTANALTGGLGNAGGGVTYFIMPAVFDSFVHQFGYTTDVAWRLTFIVPLIMVIATGVGMLLLCPDTPEGTWDEREVYARQNLRDHGIASDSNVSVIEGNTGGIHGSATTPPLEPVGRIGGGPKKPLSAVLSEQQEHQQKQLQQEKEREEQEEQEEQEQHFAGYEARLSRDEMLETAQGEIVMAPTGSEVVQVLLSAQTWVLMLTYMCSFGAELAINSTLANYYVENFPHLGQTKAADWAAMFGFLNVVTRPLGGVVSDVLYSRSQHNLWLKKGWITLCGVLSGILLIVVGCVNSHDPSTMYGLVALAAIFIEAGNGANFALVPHVHPFANGIVSGLTGAFGNFGGIVFAIIFRFMDNGTNFAKAFWVIGVIHVAVNIAVSWIAPIPKGQVGGH